MYIKRKKEENEMVIKAAIVAVAVGVVVKVVKNKK